MASEGAELRSDSDVHVVLHFHACMQIVMSGARARLAAGLPSRETNRSAHLHSAL